MYSLRPPIQKASKACAPMEVPERLDNFLETKENAMPVVPAKKHRSDYYVNRPGGGKELENWVVERFDAIDKKYHFLNSNNTLNCSDCREIIPTNEEVYCHDYPFHKECTISPTVDVENGQINPHTCHVCFYEQCYLCKNENNHNSVTKCAKCDLRFHRECLKPWPQAEVMGSNGVLICPLHFCHVCKAEHRVSHKMRDYKLNNKNSIKCMFCLAAYHKGTCVPAGTAGTIVNQYMICPRHLPDSADRKRKMIGCFVCQIKLKKSEPRLACIGCPMMFHPKCGGYDEAQELAGVSFDDFASSFKCEACNWGYFPIYGQLVWYRQPGSVFWPAIICYPSADEDPPELGRFTVFYCGGRPLVFNAKSSVSIAFQTGVEEFMKKLGIYTDKPQFLTAYEEACYLNKLTELHHESLLPKPEPYFKKIEKNLYRIPEPRKTKARQGEELELCECSKEDGDGPTCLPDSSCYNRVMSLECNDKICSGGNRCKNRFFTEKINNNEMNLECFASETKGFGLKTKINIAKGEFLLEYVGEIIGKEEYVWRSEHKLEDDCYYFLVIDSNTYIDAEYYGNNSRLINHSCQPNCKVEHYVSAQGKRVAGIFALQDIEAEEEITFDYNYGSNSRSVSLRCECGAPNCKKLIGNRSFLSRGAREDLILAGQSQWSEVCSVCNGPGRLIMCDEGACRQAYHLACVGLKSLPKNDWICPKHKRPAVKSVFKSTKVKRNLKFKLSKKVRAPLKSSIKVAAPLKSSVKVTASLKSSVKVRAPLKSSKRVAAPLKVALFSSRHRTTFSPSTSKVNELLKL